MAGHHGRDHHPGCSASVVAEPVDGGGTDEFWISHSQHNHANKQGVIVPPAQLNSEGRAAQDAEIEAAWTAWRAKPEYVTIEGKRLPLELHNQIKGTILSSDGFIQDLEFMEPYKEGDPEEKRRRPPPLLPQLVEVEAFAPCAKALRELGYVLEKERTIRFFEVPMDTVLSETEKGLRAFASVAEGLYLDKHLNMRRRGDKRGDDVQARMPGWWAKYDAQAEHSLLELGGQDAVICGTKPLAGGGTRRVPLVAVRQARDPAGLRAAVLQACEVLHRCDAWAHIDGHFDGTFLMAGLASPPCVEHTAAGYISQNNFAALATFYGDLVHKTLVGIAERVWDELVACSPELTKYREDFFSDAGRAACLGRTATNLISMTDNCAVSVHIDTADGLFSGVLWVGHVRPEFRNKPGVVHKLEGGAFVQLGTGTQVTPMDMTVMVLTGGLVAHATRPVVAHGGAHRLGFSHFTRVPAMLRVAVMAQAAGGQAALLSRQEQLTRAALAAQPGPAATAKRKAIKVWKAELLEQPKDVPAVCGFSNASLQWPQDTLAALWALRP